MSCLVYQFQHLDSFNLTTVCFAVMWSHRSVVHSEDYAKLTTLNVNLLFYYKLNLLVSRNFVKSVLLGCTELKIQLKDLDRIAPILMKTNMKRGIAIIRSAK